MACRRCSECVGSPHHWLPNPDFGNGEEPDPEWDEGEGPRHPDYEFLCKHCEALGGECPDCDGDGATYEPRFEADDEDVPCGRCGGTGVVEGLAYTGWRED